MIAFVYVWSRRIRLGMQLDAALMTAASVMVIGFGRAASTDMLLTVTFTIAMLAWYGWYGHGNRGWLLPFYFALGWERWPKGQSQFCWRPSSS